MLKAQHITDICKISKQTGDSYIHYQYLKNFLMEEERKSLQSALSTVSMVQENKHCANATQLTLHQLH